MLFTVLMFFVVQRFRADIHLRKAYDLAKNNNPEAAQAECQRAASLWPYDWSIYYGWGIISRSLGMYDRALALFSTAEQYRPGFNISYYKGEAYHKQGNLKEAEGEYKRAIFYNPNSANNIVQFTNYLQRKYGYDIFYRYMRIF